MMPKTETKKSTTKNKAVYVLRCRQRQKRLGLRRMEVAVKTKDADLLKSIVSTLRADGPEAEQLRQKIQTEVSRPKAKTGAELYAMLRELAPLADEIDLDHRDNISRTLVTFE